LTNFSNGKQTQESLKNGFPETNTALINAPEKKKILTCVTHLIIDPELFNQK
jgi:hypothetical protein